MREPLYSICQWTSPATTFEEDLGLFGAHGATGIGLCESKFRPGEDASLLAAFEASGLSATLCLPTNISPLPTMPSGPPFGGPLDPERRIEAMCDSIKRLAPFRPAAVVVLTGSAADREPRAARAIAVEGLARAAEVARRCETRLCLEPMRDMPGWDGSIVRSMRDTLDLLDDVGASNIDICFDVYHLWDSPNVLKLARAHGARVAGVQVNDWPAVPRGVGDRLLPGDGTIDLASLFAALEDGGFRGWYDLEVFSDDGEWNSLLPGSVLAGSIGDALDRAYHGFRHAWERRDA